MRMYLIDKDGLLIIPMQRPHNGAPRSQSGEFLRRKEV